MIVLSKGSLLWTSFGPPKFCFSKSFLSSESFLEIYREPRIGSGILSVPCDDLSLLTSFE